MNAPLAILQRASWREWQRIQTILRTESIGGLLLLGATAVALVLANTAPAAYVGLRDAKVGADLGPLHLNLSLGHWAADGLLALFFFLAGLELKREFLVGDLRDPRRAVVPIVAAVGGVALPAAIYVLANLNAGAEALGGWAIPAATDIAFALAVLAVIGSHLPSALRTFLLTLAVVDDLIAITIIALFYTSELSLAFLGAGLLAVGLYAFVVRRWRHFFSRSAVGGWLILLPLAFLAWALIYNSGIHATVAGVLLAFTVPVEANNPDFDLAHEFEHRFRPLSAGVAVPIFAFFSAGVVVDGWNGLVEALTDTVGIGIVLALVVGKAVGVTGGTWLATRLRHTRLDPDLGWVDVLGLSALAGIGFTVSLLINDLSFGPGNPHTDHGKIAILTGSVLAALIAAVILGARNRRYREVEAHDLDDADADGVPDKYAEVDPLK